MTPVILVDVDEVVADFIGRYLEIASTVMRQDFDREKIWEWDLHKACNLPTWAIRDVQYQLRRPGVASSLSIYKGSVDAIKMLSELGDIVFLSAPYPGSQTWTSDRAEWLELHFGKLGRKFISTRDKEYVSGTAFIDDKPANLIKWGERQSGKALLWNKPHNQEEGPWVRCFDWNAVRWQVEKQIEYEKQLR